ncbi:MAG: dihydrofolate reductase family protein [Saprospiraceae bacterium]
MRKIKLFIASSLDGFIARPDGALDWLPTDGNDYGYHDFITTIDTTLMGGKTYRDVLKFGEFPYKNLQNFVFTRDRAIKKNPNVKFVPEQICHFTQTLKNQAGKDIWLIGGSEIIAELYNTHLIDEYIITIIPTILGRGIPLFTALKKQAYLQLTNVKSYPSGVVQLLYRAVDAPPEAGMPTQ